MFVELIESLRCPRPHEESALVVASARAEARHIMEGVLGCPVCGAEFPIVEGVALFGEPETPARDEPPAEEVAMRLAAFLGLTEPRGVAAICGRWASHAAPLSALTEAPLVLVNAPDGGGRMTDFAAASLRTRDTMPFAAASLRACALDASTGAALTESLMRCVRPGGRVIAPVSVALPAGVAEIVRDASVWVAEKTAAPDAPAPRLVSIGRAPR